jgi:aminoglycoside/choline kinase family phosphotransferase
MPESPSRLILAGDERLSAAVCWAALCLGEDVADPVPIAGDASFRRYFRLQTRRGPLILMDAPPGREDSRPFIDIAGRLRAAGLHAPRIEHFDLDQGFGLIEDLGDRLYRDHLTPETAARLMPPLFDALQCMAREVPAAGLPAYDDARLQQELDLFTDWYLARHRGVQLAAADLAAWRDARARLCASAGEQPQVFVHRDFHSCNLLLRADGTPGIIDFQDAVIGPLSYDFVSLIWDRYIAWPRERLEEWMREMHTRLALRNSLPGWIRWCDWMGMQRNLKIVGIFACLHYRDGRRGYLEMIPRFYRYLLDVLPAYAELGALRALLERAECAP